MVDIDVESSGKQADQTEPAVQADILVGDLARFLVGLAKVQQDDRLGNRAVSDGLRLLAACLRPHKARPISDLADLRMTEKGESRHRSGTRKSTFELPSDLESVTLETVTGILRNGDVQKKQLIELAGCRFGIPGSRLSRVNREEAVAAIEAAVEHELSIMAIERGAQLAGQRRVA